MNISVLDGSNYFKGLLLLISKDKKISKEEHELITAIGISLGFDKEFIEEAIQEILYNSHISVTPPIFSSRELAEKFVKDGLVIAFSDNEMHPDEDSWLFSVAETNKIEKEWVYVEKRIIQSQKRDKRSLEADHLRVQY